MNSVHRYAAVLLSASLVGLCIAATTDPATEPATPGTFENGSSFHVVAPSTQPAQSPPPMVSPVGGSGSPNGPTDVQLNNGIGPVTGDRHPSDAPAVRSSDAPTTRPAR